MLTTCSNKSHSTRCAVINISIDSSSKHIGKELFRESVFADVWSEITCISNLKVGSLKRISKTKWAVKLTTSKFTIKVLMTFTISLCKMIKSLSKVQQRKASKLKSKIVKEVNLIESTAKYRQNRTIVCNTFYV